MQYRVVELFIAMIIIIKMHSTLAKAVQKTQLSLALKQNKKVSSLHSIPFHTTRHHILHIYIIIVIT